MKLEFIAEVGINHNGSLKKALEYCDLAKNCGADIVKFQTFQTDNILVDNTPLADYQILNTDFKSQNKMLKKSELSYSDFNEIKNYCNKIGIEFLTTAYDFRDIDFIANVLKCKKLKLASISIVEKSLLEFALEKFEEVIISTGFTNARELEKISNDNYLNQSKLTVMHCTSSYPCELEDANINTIKHLYQLFPESKIGFSDHTLDSIAASLSVALGATIFEKHITFNKNDNGPDHIMSMEPSEYQKYINLLRKSQTSLGSNIRVRTESESKNIINMRRSLFAKVDIKKGKKINYMDLVLLRPNKNQNQYLNPVGKKATKDIYAGELLDFESYE